LLGIPSLLSVLIAFLLTGSGHGWVSAFFFSFLPLLITPFTVHAYVNSKKGISIIILGLYVFATCALYLVTLKEGREYFERVFGGLMILFFIFWLSPFMLNIHNLFRNTHKLQS
jgi:hypothetical protein